MRLRKLLISILIYFATLGIVVAQNSQTTIPTEVIKKVIFETELLGFLHFDLPERKILYLKSKPHLKFKSLQDPRVKIITLDSDQSSKGLNVIEINSWKGKEGIYKLSLSYDSEGVVSWFKFTKKKNEWKLLKSWIAET